MVDTQAWSRPRISGSLPFSRHGLSMAHLNNVLYMIGGMTTDDGFLPSDLYALDFSQRKQH
jgi:hypothetical protein